MCCLRDEIPKVRQTFKWLAAQGQRMCSWCPGLYPNSLNHAPLVYCASYWSHVGTQLEAFEAFEALNVATSPKLGNLGLRVRSRTLSRCSHPNGKTPSSEILKIHVETWAGELFYPSGKKQEALHLVFRPPSAQFLHHGSQPQNWQHSIQASIHMSQKTCSKQQHAALLRLSHIIGNPT